MKHRTSTALALGFLLATSGCEEKKNDAAAEASAKASAAPAPTPSTPPVEEKPVKVRPVRDAKLDVELTDERRTKVEEAIPDAKGFLAAADIEKELHAKKFEEEDPALKAFDAKAKGKWVLFTGNMNNMSADGFTMPVIYTPRAEGDPMGVSMKWFEVTFTNVEGFDKEKLKNGEKGVVLAKYEGDKKATPAHELIELEHW